MTQVTESALFEVLNAKKMSPREIAASFVWLAQFDQLIGPDHSYLIGPRGSGKTTLLRMLQGESLMQWEHRRAVEYRNRIRFSAVFLPADRLWVSQTNEDPRGELHGPYGVAAFCTQMLSALVETLQYRIGYFETGIAAHLPAELRHRDEVDLVAECAAAWRLPIRTASLNGLLGALDLRLTTLATMMAEHDVTVDTKDLVGEYPWLRIPPVEAFRFGLRAINRYTRQPNHRWALLLDEMELAPKPVHQALTGAVRGGERNLVLKLSFSPFDRFVSARGQLGDAVDQNDFRAIYLWYGNRTGSRRFAGGLWRRMAAETTGTYRPAISILGPSQIDASGSTWRQEAYQSDSKQMRLITRMASVDQGFSEFLNRRGIDLARVKELSYAERSASLRKAYPLLVFRDALLDFHPDGTTSRRQRKKIAEVFSGVDAVFAALEGNPRWMKAVFSRILGVYDPHSRVEPGTQYDALLEAAERFESLLRVLPGDENRTSFPVLELLDMIARHFHARALGPFSADPPSLFRVDGSVPDEVLAALKTALSAGAIVHIRTKQSPPVLPSLIGERFRLAYLLAIRDHLEIPIRVGKVIDLSSILAKEVGAQGTGERLRSAILMNPMLPFLPGDSGEPL